MPTAERYCRYRRIRPAGDTSAGYSAAVPGPAMPATPATRRLRAHRTRAWNSTGVDAQQPHAAATRSSVRVVAFPIGAALSLSLRSLLVVLHSCCRVLFFLRSRQSPGPDGFVQRVGQHLQLTRHFRHALSFLQQRPRLLQDFSQPAPTPNSGAPWSRRTLSLRALDTLSRIASP